VSPTAELLAVLLLVWWWESTLLLPRGAVAFVAWPARRYRRRAPAEMLGNERGGLLLAPLLPPLGRVHECRADRAGSLDVAAVKARVAEFEQATARIRVACNLAFLWWTVVVPVAALTVGFASSWPWLLLGVVACGATLVPWFVCVHRRLHPALRDDRRRAAVAMALAPLEAVRALDALARPLLAAFHPLAVSLALQEPAAGEALLARELREALHPLGAPDPAWLARVRALAAEQGFAEASLLAPPPPHGAASRHCPRCHQRFAAVVDTCSDCPGVALRDG
jgi:hypothetical protein